MKDKFIVMLVTCASKKEARNIVDSLLAKKLVACGNILPEVESKFRWKGKIDTSTEALLVLKTVLRNFRKVESEIKRLHSYEVPEIIALPVIAGSKDYLNWVKDNIAPNLTVLRGYRAAVRNT